MLSVTVIQILLPEHGIMKIYDTVRRVKKQEMKIATYPALVGAVIGGACCWGGYW